MRRIIFKSFIGSIILLFCASNLQAQYTVFRIKGEVEMSQDGKTWNLLKKKDELKDSYQIRVSENSLVDIIDSKNLIYSYDNPKVVSVGDIVKQKKTILESMGENLGMRKAFGGTVRSNGDDIVVAPDSIYVIFNDAETLVRYNSLDSIPAGVVFFITICNQTDEDKTVNVYQKGENEELTSCFPKDIYLEKSTAIEMTDILFGKQENDDEFVVVAK